MSKSFNNETTLVNNETTVNNEEKIKKADTVKDHVLNETSDSLVDNSTVKVDVDDTKVNKDTETVKVDSENKDAKVDTTEAVVKAKNRALQDKDEAETIIKEMKNKIADLDKAIKDVKWWKGLSADDQKTRNESKYKKLLKWNETHVKNQAVDAILHQMHSKRSVPHIDTTADKEKLAALDIDGLEQLLETGKRSLTLKIQEIENPELFIKREAPKRRYSYNGSEENKGQQKPRTSSLGVKNTDFTAEKKITRQSSSTTGKEKGEGSIAGVVTGVGLVGFAVAVVVFLVFRRRRKSRSSNDSGIGNLVTQDLEDNCDQKFITTKRDESA